MRGEKVGENWQRKTCERNYIEAFNLVKLELLRFQINKQHKKWGKIKVCKLSLYSSTFK